MRSKNKEYFIILPNYEECPAGKHKDENKLSEIVQAEYNLSDVDKCYFNFIKSGNKYTFQLCIIPESVEKLESINAKKFVLFELIKQGLNSTIKFDDDLNKRAKIIYDLIRNDDPGARETIRSRLSTILDNPGELDQLVDQMLTDAQFNSFKFTVLTDKSSCIMCVNQHAIFFRSLNTPFSVESRIEWSEISTIKKKRRKLLVTKTNQETMEISCVNKKVSDSANECLLRIQRFATGSPGSPAEGEHTQSPSTSGGMFVRLASRIRKSFSRGAPRAHTLDRSTAHKVAQNPASERRRSSLNDLKQPLGMHQQLQTLPGPGSSTAVTAAASSPLIPLPTASSVATTAQDETSYISADQENPQDQRVIRSFEPSVKTNSTYDVSIGSQTSLRPITAMTLEQTPEIGKLHQQLHHGIQPHTTIPSNNLMGTTSSGPVFMDDHFSVKTTSTYEVALDNAATTAANASPTSLANHRSHDDKDGSPPPPAFSIPVSNSQSRTSPPLMTSFGTPDNQIRSSQPAAMTTFGTTDNQTRQPVVMTSFTTPSMVVAMDTPDMTSFTAQPVSNVHDHEARSQQPLASIGNQPDYSDSSEKKMSVISGGGQMTFQESRYGDFSSHDNSDSVAKVTKSVPPAPPVRLDTAELPPQQPSVSLDTENDDILQTETVAVTASVLLEPSQSQKTEMEEVDDCVRKVYVPTAPSVVGDTSAPSSHSCSEHISVDAVTPPSSRLPVARQTSIPSPKLQRPSRIPAIPGATTAPAVTPTSRGSRSPSDKENYSGAGGGVGSSSVSMDVAVERLESRTTITSVATVGDSIVKKSTRTDTVVLVPAGGGSPNGHHAAPAGGGSGIQPPRQYKSTTTITSTAKKPVETAVPSSPEKGSAVSSGPATTSMIPQSRIPTSGIPTRKKSSTAQ